MSRVLVTGVNGFVGIHLAESLVKAGHEVVGTGLSDTLDDTIAPRLADYYRCDLTSANDVAKLPLDQIDGVINLAGLAAVGKSFDAPDEYMRINTAVLSVICDEIIARGLRSRIRMLAISSGAVYANNQPMPLTEESIISDESSPYAASKLAMEKLAFDYTKAGLQCIVARPFNHIGPKQGEGFLLPDLYAQLTDALSSGQPMKVGNLATQRDYTDVRDIATAYTALITAPSLGHQLYNVCSGQPRSGKEVLRTLMEVTSKSVEVQIDQSKFRPSDAPVLYGDRFRITGDIGWQPRVSFEQTIADYVASVSS